MNSPSARHAGETGQEGETHCRASQLQNSKVSSPIPHPREKSANLRIWLLWFESARACSLLYRYNLTIWGGAYMSLAMHYS